MSIIDVNPEFEALLDYLKQARGFDFTGYKRPSLIRRVQQRMQAIQIESYNDYINYIQINKQEFKHLFNTIEINVTNFFRDELAWDYVVTQVIGKIIAGKSESEPIRVWSAGCASGEETYTLAIILAEALGVEQFCSRVRIYGTGVDKEALNQAQLGSYVINEIMGIPPTLLARYFEQTAHHYVFRKDLRRSIIFGCHNIIADPPMSQIDLLVCRNVLIYFNIEAQTRALARFHFSLKRSGFLFLGKAEMLPTHTNFFTPVDIKQRIFVKVPRGPSNQYQLVAALGRQKRLAK